MALVAVVACTHGEPYPTDPPDPLGPADAGLPRQLTFTRGDDRGPTVTGTTVAFSRLDADAALRECIALLPVEGGTLRATLCPPAPTPRDTFISSWLEPSLSPDGSRVAYVWRRHAQWSLLSAWSYDLVIASVDSPGVPLVSRPLTGPLPDGRIVNTAMEIAWTGPERLRFLAALESVGRVQGAGARLTDTSVTGRVLMDFDVTTGTVTPVAGGDSVRCWAPGPGYSYIVRDRALTTVFALAADGARDTVGRFASPITDLAWVGGMLVAAVAEQALHWIDPRDGGSGRVPLPGITRRLAPAGPDRAVAEVERRGGDAFGAPANLWLVRVPAF